MKVEVKVLYRKKYKSDKGFFNAVERWQDKGWESLYAVYALLDKDTYEILFKEIEEE